MHYINLVWTEGKKLFQQREIYIALFLCTVLFVMGMGYAGERDTPYEFWNEFTGAIPWVGFWFIAVLIVVGVAKCLPFEREQEMGELMLTYKRGRLQLLIVKQIVIFIYCSVVVLYFFVVSFFILAMDYDIAGLFAQVKVNPPHYLNANLEWTFAQLLLYEYGYTVLASFIFGLFTLLLSLLIKRSVFIMMIAGSIFAIGELYDKFIQRFIGTLELNNYLSAVYDYGFNGMLSYKYLGSFKPFSDIEIYIMFLLIACSLFALNLFIGRWRRYAAMGD